MSTKLMRQFQDEDFLLYRLPHVARMVSLICAHEYMSYDMKPSEWRLIAQVGRFGNISAKVLSDKMALDQVTVSRSVRRCIKRKLIRGIVNPLDRRSKVLILTPTGKVFLERFYPHACELALRVERGLERTEVKQLKRLLSKLNEHLGTFSPFSTAE